MMYKSAFACAAMLAIATSALGQNEKRPAAQPEAKPEVKPLTVGDSARPIDIEHWVKGNKVTEFEPGKVYVLEFWATWCGPCKKGMPHLAELQQHYKDYGVTIIGISDEPLETVTNFLPKTDKEGKSWDQKTAYTLTTDPDKSVKTDYFTAAGQSGIPCAFIIGKDQKIEWIGNPIWPEGAFDKALEGVVKDSWDREAYKQQWEKEQATQREAMKAQMELRNAMMAKDWDKVLGILDKQIADNPEEFGLKMQKFMTMLVQMDQPDKAYAYGDEIAKAHWDDAMMLNQLAWFVVDSPTVKTRNLDFALKTATRASEITHDQDPAILDTLARVYFDKGDLKSAIRLQKKALEHAGDDEMGQAIKATLEKYEAELVKKAGR